MTIEEIYQLYFDELYRYVKTLTGGDIVCDDIVNETFLKAMLNIEKVNQYNIIAWLKTVAKNAYLNKLRERRYVATIENIDNAIDYPLNDNLPENFICKIDAAQARMILHKLPDPCREVYMWRVFVGLKHQEIGELFGMNENWSNQVYLRARKKILSELKD